MGLLSSVGKVVGKVLGTNNQESSGSNLLSYLAVGGLNAAGALGTSVLNGYFSRQAASKEYQYTTNLMNYQNDYNTPLAQRQRLIEAGYNPNLFYNTGANSSASGSVHVQAPKASALDLLGAYNLMEQNNLLKSQASKADAEAIEAGKRSQLIQTQIDNWEHDHSSPYKDLVEGVAYLYNYINKGKDEKGFFDPAPYTDDKFDKIVKRANERIKMRKKYGFTLDMPKGLW